MVTQLCVMKSVVTSSGSAVLLGAVCSAHLISLHLDALQTINVAMIHKYVDDIYTGHLTRTLTHKPLIFNRLIVFFKMEGLVHNHRNMNPKFSLFTQVCYLINWILKTSSLAAILWIKTFLKYVCLCWTGVCIQSILKPEAILD